MACANDLAALQHGASFWNVPTVRFQGDGRLWIRDGSQLHIWDPRQKVLANSLRISPRPQEAQGDCGVGTWGRLPFVNKEGLIGIFDLIANERLCVLDGLGAKYIADKSVHCQISANGRRVLVRAREKDGLRIHWFDADKGKELGSYFIAAKDFLGAEPYDWRASWYADDGSLFGFVAPDQRLVLVDCAMGKVTLTLGPVHPGKPGVSGWNYYSLHEDRFFHAQGKDADKNFHRLWDRQGHLLRQFRLPPVQTLSEQIWSDGRIAAVNTNGKRLDLFETATSRLRGQIDIPQGLSSFAFAPDGKLLATSHTDTSILLWDFNRPLSGKPGLPVPQSLKEAEKLWSLLGTPDPQQAEPALWALVRAPDQSLLLMKKHLQPEGAPDMEPFKKWDDAAPSLRELRALEVLERIGSAAARQLVAAMAVGAEGAVLTAEARLILARWPELSP